MYYYIYDLSCRQRRYRKLLDQIETKWAALGIRGKIGRLNLLTSARELILTGKRNGAKAIVIVGEDATVFRALPDLLHASLAIGFLPLPSSSLLGRVLGIPSGELACDILAQRRIKHLDIGIANGHPFLHSLMLRNITAHITVERYYTITPLQASDCCVFNLPSLPSNNDRQSPIATSPIDGSLDVVFQQKKRLWPLARQYGGKSYFPLKKMTVTGDGEVTAERDFLPTSLPLPISIHVLSERLPFIVGKERLFP